MTRNYIPDCQKDAAYYKRRSNNAASVKMFREKKRKAEEQHNQKITILKQRTKDLIREIQILSGQYQAIINNLTYNYVTTVNKIHDICNNEIVKRIDILNEIVCNIPEIKTRNYGLKKITDQFDSTSEFDQNDNQTIQNHKFTDCTCKNKC